SGASRRATAWKACSPGCRSATPYSKASSPTALGSLPLGDWPVLRVPAVRALFAAPGAVLRRRGHERERVRAEPNKLSDGHDLGQHSVVLAFDFVPVGGLERLLGEVVAASAPLHQHMARLAVRVRRNELNGHVPATESPDLAGARVPLLRTLVF